MTLNVTLNKIRSYGLEPVPVFPNSKKPEDNNWQNRKYDNARFLDDNNVGANLAMSKVLHVDADNIYSVHFCKKYLPQDTLIIGRMHKVLDNNGKEKTIHVVTNYFYQNNGIIKENQSLKYNGEQVLEFRCNGQTIVHGKTPLKEDKTILCERYIHNDAPIATSDNIEYLVNKIYVACILCEYEVGANQGALKLDSCLMRYTNWSDSEREDFIYDICEITDKHSRDFTRKKMQNHVRSNNKGTKNSGYISLAQQLGADKLEIKNLFKRIGSVPDSDNYEKVKSIVDFNEKAIDIPDLMATELEPLKWAVCGMVPEGFGVMAGRPKAMKSWTALETCFAVQNGIKFMGHETTQGDCLYLALEDSKRRIKSRIKKLKNEKLKSPTILLAKDIPYLGFGFEECVEMWIASKENPRLIIIDTLARIKPRMGRKSGTAYDIDNELLGKIQTIAVTKNISIAFITHLSKADTEYSFDRIQGSVGVQGMTDFMWLIDRGDNSDHASIIGRGRDMKDFEYAVKWNEDKWRYEFTGNLQMVQTTQNRQEVVEAMKFLSKEKAEIAPREVCKYYNFSVQSKDGKRISKTMQRMEGDFELIKGQKYGTYKLPQQIKQANNEDKPNNEDKEWHY